MVDLNGAFSGRSVNGAAVKAILDAATVPVQLGGGVRDLEAVETWLGLGVARGIEVVLFWTNSGDRTVEFLHSFTLIALAWIVLGSWVALFPGTLEPLFGVDYAFEEIWGLSRVRFEVFTLGTMAVVILLGIVGYLGGAKLRATIGPDPEAPAQALD